MLTLRTVTVIISILTRYVSSGLLTDLCLYTQSRTGSSSGTLVVWDGPLARETTLSLAIIGIEVDWTRLNRGKARGKMEQWSRVEIWTRASTLSMETGAHVLHHVEWVSRHVPDVWNVAPSVLTLWTGDHVKLLHVQLIVSGEDGVAGVHVPDHVALVNRRGHVML